ncbi:Uncharacterised protein [Mycobacteroides abscessus subsp. abscessus]|nr:Uncharacterised protein [Mycobacteroides abscessus subsp. abscessus]
MGAARGEQPGQFPADAGARAGDQRDPSLQVEDRRAGDRGERDGGEQPAQPWQFHRVLISYESASKCRVRRAYSKLQFGYRPELAPSAVW